MSKMMIGWRDRISTATLTADTEESTMPVENLQVATFDLIWRSTAAPAYVDIDLGASLSFRVLALSATNLTSSATIRVRASDTDTTTGDLLDTTTVSAGVDDDDTERSVYLVFGAEVTARYLRIDLADAALSYIDVGHAMLTPVVEPATDALLGSAAILPFDLGRKVQTAAGQVQVDTGPRGRGVEFTLDLNQAQAMSFAVQLDREAGVTGNVMVLLEQSGSYVWQHAVVGTVSEAAPLRLTTFSRYRKRYVVRQRVGAL